MTNTWLIVKREYIERVRSKAFVFMTLLVPGIMLIAFGAVFFTTARAGANQNIAIASNDADLAMQVRDSLARSEAAPIHAVVVAPATQAERDALIAQVSNKHLDGYVWLGVKPGGEPDVQYDSRSSSDLFVKSRIQEAVSNAEMRSQLKARGLPPAEVDRLMAQVDVSSGEIKNGRVVSSDTDSSFWIGYIMVFLLYFSITYYSMNVARSVIQEKTSRIFEVMLATVKPEEMMAGKMLGVGAAGLTQIALWIVIALLAVAATALSHGALPPMHLKVSLAQLAAFCVYFLLGFALYSAAAAAAGACFNAESEVQQLSFVLVMPMFVAVMSYAYILSSPNAAYSVVLSMLPPTAPLAMFLRITAQTPPWWQIAISLALMVLAIYAMVWIAARIYRVGILMYGKRPTLPELLRWLKYS
jgi:ABC-2 type transport system permease protein